MIAKSVSIYQKKIPGLGKDFTFDRVVLGRIVSSLICLFFLIFTLNSDYISYIC